MHARWWASLDGLKRIGLTYALQGVRLVPNGDLLDIRTDEPELAEENDDQRRIFAWAAEWSRLCFPIVQMSHRYAAALMCTSVPPIDDGDIRPPWSQFLVKVPSGLLSIPDPSGVQLSVDHLACTHHAGHWSIYAFTAETLLAMPWRSTQFLRDAKAADLDNPTAVFSDHQEALEQQDERVLVCLGRLVLNLCLAFSDPLNVREIGKGHTSRGHALPGGPREAPHRIFELGRPVSVDCREYVRSFVTGARSRLAVRLLVRGFWRNQPHGVGNTLRRRQWIEPYWKGDVGAPLLVRPHDLQRT